MPSFQTCCLLLTPQHLEPKNAKTEKGGATFLLPGGEKQADATVQIPQLTLAMQPAWTLFPVIG